MCNTPVTFGGGMTTVNGGQSSGVELKYRFDFQCDVHFSSIDLGSKFFDNSIFSMLFYFSNCCASLPAGRQVLNFSCDAPFKVLFAVELNRITMVQECDARDGEGCNTAKYPPALVKK